MNLLLILSASVFSLVLFYYSILTVFGLYYRTRARDNVKLVNPPSVDVLIPAHNEGKVIQKTLEAIVKLNYPGEIKIYLLDDNSMDNTGEIARAFAERFNNLIYVDVPSGLPSGKPRVLNYGLSISNSDYVVIYDADNQPEPQSLQLLVETAVNTIDSGGAVGYVRTINESKNWLTRMISLEFQVFQLLMQSGRWALFKTGSLTGTNMLLKRSVIDEIGGYDVYALAEDAELTLRITNLGKLLPIVPEAVTWEQEPEKIRVLIKQRTRWLQGNLYLLEKMFSSKEYFKKKMLVHTSQQILVYIIFLVFLLISNIWFVAGIFGYTSLELKIPLLFIWYVAYLTYTVQLFSSQIVEKTLSPMNMLMGFLSYFTYAQLFIYLYFRSLYYYIKAKKNKITIEWDKTIRF